MQNVQRAIAATWNGLAKTPTLLRSWGLRLTRKGRRRLALEHGALHSQTRTPGLRDVDATGVLRIHENGTDIPVHWYEVGPSEGEQAPLTVVFIHGFTLAGESWYRQFEVLRGLFPRVRLLTLDLRGHGQTGAVPAKLCTVNGAAADAITLIQKRAPEGPIVVVGHSLGGLIALNILRSADEALRARIGGMVLIATSIDRLSAQGLPQILASPVADAAREAMESSPKQIRKFRESIAALIAPSLAVAVFSRPTNYSIVEFHAAMIQETPLETFVGYLDDLQEHQEFAARPYLEGLPGAVLVGSRDDVTPRGQADLILEAWPDAELVEVKDAGHMLPLETPGVVNSAIKRVVEKALKTD